MMWDVSLYTEVILATVASYHQATRNFAKYPALSTGVRTGLFVPVGGRQYEPG